MALKLWLEYHLGQYLKKKKTMLDLGHNKNLIKGYIHAKDYFGYHQLGFLSQELLNLFILNRYLPNTFSHRIQKLLQYTLRKMTGL